MGEYVVTVWDIETGEAVRKLWDATAGDLDDIEGEFENDPGVIVEADYK